MLIYYIKNIFKNIIYGLFPSLVIKIKKPTGRGGTTKINSYHFDIFNSYFKHLDVEDIQEFIRDKTVVEIGPGNVLGTAFYSIVYGAKKVICIDRFPVVFFKEQYNNFVSLIDYLPNHLKGKASEILKNYDDLKNRIVYYSDLTGRFTHIPDIKADIILSNAVLEHVYDLPSLFNMLSKISDKNALMFHGVDLRSHTMHYKNELDFLNVPIILWKLMTCFRGAPNRITRSEYINIFESHNFKILRELIEKKYDTATVKEYILYNKKNTVDIKDLEIAIIGFVCKVC